MTRIALVGLVGLAVLPAPMRGQAVPLPGRTTLFELNPADTPVGEFPSTIKLLNGIMSVELKDGAPMLKASSASEFLITLPRALPERFVLEFELVPKACCNPHDLSFEGTPTINQGLGSAHVLWDSDGYLAVIGGAQDNYESPVPEELRVTTPGVMTSVMAVVEGTTIQLYTNGRRLFTLTDRHFVRSRSLRIHLGGQDDETQAVYLARMRVTGGSLPPAVVAGLPTPPPGRPERQAPAAVEGQAPAQSPPPTLPPPTPGQPTETFTDFQPVRTRADGGADLYWGEVAGAERYDVLQSTDGQAFRVVATVDRSTLGAAGFTAAIVSLQPGQRYYFQIVARRADGSVLANSLIRVFDAPPGSSGAGTTPSALPDSRAITLNAVRASGGSSTAAGGAILVSSRTIELAGLTATGPTRVP